jgi:pyridoxine 5'-phosphate synthase PdxJ
VTEPQGRLLGPDDLVPERREEVTTEGGLAVRRHVTLLADSITRLKRAGVRSSLFIDPDPDDIRCAADLGADAIELHTGRYADAHTPEEAADELARIEDAELVLLGVQPSELNKMSLQLRADVLEINAAKHAIARGNLHGQ